MAHKLAHLLDAVAHGGHPEADGRIEVMPALGQVSAMLGFTAHWVLAADVGSDFVSKHYSDDDYSVPMSAAFLEAVANEIGAVSKTHDVVLVARSQVGEPSLDLTLIEDSDHPRVRRANRYRRDVRAYATSDGAGVLVLGRGITNRWEVGVEVDASAQSLGIGRALFDAALRMLPPGTPVWAQVAPGNPASLRSVLASGFTPVGSEVLFVA